jgi:hypothetical protein
MFFVFIYPKMSTITYTDFHGSQCLLGRGDLLCIDNHICRVFEIKDNSIILCWTHCYGYMAVNILDYFTPENISLYQIYKTNISSEPDFTEIWYNLPNDSDALETIIESESETESDSESCSDTE